MKLGLFFELSNLTWSHKSINGNFYKALSSDEFHYVNIVVEVFSGLLEKLVSSIYLTTTTKTKFWANLLKEFS